MKRRRRVVNRNNQKPKKLGNKFLKRLLIILMLIVAFAVLIVSLMFFASSSRWDGKSKFAYAIPNPGGDVSVVLVDPASSTVLNILIPKNTQVNASNQLGSWKMGSIYPLDQHENLKGMLLKSTIFKTFQMPIDGWSEKPGVGLISSNPLTAIKSIFLGFRTDISFKDKVKLAFYSMRARTANRVNLNLAESGSLDKVILPDGEEGYVVTREIKPSVLAYFTDSVLTQKSIRVEIINASGVGGIATQLANGIEAMGAQVMSIENSEVEDLVDCEVIGQDAVAVKKISQMFGCRESVKTTQNNFDIQFIMGKGFTGRY